MNYVNPPAACDLCKQPLTHRFYDAAMKGGPWANMCPFCYSQHGVGTGTGKGQVYEKQEDGNWLKVGG